MIAFGAGLVAWTFLEYALHRWVFHEQRLAARMAEEHLRHHAEVSWFAPWGVKLALAAPVTTGLTVLAWPVFGLGSGLALSAGVVAGWLAYEWHHRRLHTHGPSGPYGRWARRHHFLHHFRDPRRNHGVTSPLWDWVFGTWLRADRVVVPARQARHLPWLTGPDGRIAPAVARDFALAERKAPSPAT